MMTTTRPQPPAVRGEHRRPARFRQHRALAATLLCVLAGLAVVEVADVRAFDGGGYTVSAVLLLGGLALVFAPVAARVLARGTGRTERLALIVLLGLALYAVKIQGSPGTFTFFDEYIHLRNTQDILRSGHLFQYNPLLPTAAYYPGLAAVTATIVNLTGLSPVTAGLIVVGVARIIVSACFYLVAEKVTGSSRAAGAAGLVYAANPMFLFFSASFSYENLGLPLAAFAVWWLSRTRGLTRRRSRLAAQLITVTAIAAVVVTHHVSAFALAGLLAMWFVAELALRRPRPGRRYVGAFAAITGAAALGWFFLVAKPAAGYIIGQNIGPALSQAAAVLLGRSGSRQLYSGTLAPPHWYILAGFAAIGLLLVALVPAVCRAWRAVRPGRPRGAAAPRRQRAAIAVAAVIAIAFPLTLLPRLTAVGGAISARSSEYVFFGLGCVLGLLIDKGVRLPRVKTALATALTTVVFLGEVTIGTSFFLLLPQSSQPQGFPLDVQPDMVAAATWARQHLGTNQVFAADSVNELALATAGDENVANDDVIYPIYFTAGLDSAVIKLIKENKIHYVLVDWRMTAGRPKQPGGYYFSQWEPGAGNSDPQPLPAAYLAKFGAYTCSNQVYQSGPIQIYDVSGIASGTCAPEVTP
jgi:hypothetical protein